MDGWVIRTLGLAIQIHAYYIKTLHGLNFVPLSMQKAVLIKSLFWNFIYRVYTYCTLH